MANASDYFGGGASPSDILGPGTYSGATENGDITLNDSTAGTPSVIELSTAGMISFISRSSGTGSSPTISYKVIIDGDFIYEGTMSNNHDIENTFGSPLYFKNTLRVEMYLTSGSWSGTPTASVVKRTV